MKHVGPTRVELGTRTIFNLLGPLSNPAGVKRQLVGVFSPDGSSPSPQVLGNLGSDAAWVVHGDGLDEITTTGPTDAVLLEERQDHALRIDPSDVGLARAHARSSGRRWSTMPRACSPCSMASARLSRHRAPQCGGRADGRRPAPDLAEGAASRRGDRLRSGRGRARRLIAVSNAMRPMADILTQIEAYKRDEIARRQDQQPLADR